MSFTERARRLAGQTGLLLGWRPDEFWRATPDEVETALAAMSALSPEASAGLDRAALVRLMEIHPDG